MSPGESHRDIRDTHCQGATPNEAGPIMAESDLLPRPDIDIDEVARYRLGRVRRELIARDIDAALLTSPVSLRYAVDFREYQLFQSRIPTFLLVVPAEGDVVMYGASQAVPLVDQIRPGLSLNTFERGLAAGGRSERLLGDIAREFAGRGGRLAVERMHTADIAVLRRCTGVIDADPLMESARSIKSAGELACMRHSIAVAGHAMDLMQRELRPGVTENELLAVIHRVNIANDGSWLDGRMLASGPRTNPWLQEATDKTVAAGELVGLDTDMIGPFGYCADISRTFLCGDGEATPAQRDLYRHAYEEVHHNIGLIAPGVGFRELSQRAFKVRPEFMAHRYPCLAHGVGMTDEWPSIRYFADWHRGGFDGVIEENMTLCVESFTGAESGGEGVKLEQMVHVTGDGCELLSDYPFEPRLL